MRHSGSVQPHEALWVVDPVSSAILAANESCKVLIGSARSLRAPGQYLVDLEPSLSNIQQ
jgi:light-regulated signal transduction histidine kinase (bacteriophytochrome)